MEEPILDVAHLSHLELMTPKPEESLRFFVDVMGMTESGWLEGEFGHGPSYRFHDPDGHVIELYYETEWYRPPETLRPALKNQAQRYPARGANVRRLDHFNCLAVDIRANREFLEKYLGFRLTEQIVRDSGEEAGMWPTATNKSYDFAYTKEAHGVKGRFHHITYALDSREDVLRAADMFLEAGVKIETGPHKHAVQQTFSSTCSNPAATASRSPTPERASCSPPTGSRSAGPTPRGGKGRRGG